MDFSPCRSSLPSCPLWHFGLVDSSGVPCREGLCCARTSRPPGASWLPGHFVFPSVGSPTLRAFPVIRTLLRLTAEEGLLPAFCGRRPESLCLHTAGLYYSAPGKFWCACSSNVDWRTLRSSTSFGASGNRHCPDRPQQDETSVR